MMQSALVGLLLAHPGGSALSARVDSAAVAEARIGFSGAVLIARGDTVVLDKAYGNAAAGSATGPLAFWLASDSKQFTAAAILRLLQTGLTVYLVGARRGHGA